MELRTNRLILTCQTYTDPPHGHDGAANDQRSGVRGAERSLGRVQARKWALSRFLKEGQGGRGMSG